LCVCVCVCCHCSVARVSLHAAMMRARVCVHASMMCARLFVVRVSLILSRVFVVCQWRNAHECARVNKGVCACVNILVSSCLSVFVCRTSEQKTSAPRGGTIRLANIEWSPAELAWQESYWFWKRAADIKTQKAKDAKVGDTCNPHYALLLLASDQTVCNRCLLSITFH